MKMSGETHEVYDMSRNMYDEFYVAAITQNVSNVTDNLSNVTESSTNVTDHVKSSNRIK